MDYIHFFFNWHESDGQNSVAAIVPLYICTVGRQKKLGQKLQMFKFIFGKFAPFNSGLLTNRLTMVWWHKKKMPSATQTFVWRANSSLFNEFVCKLSTMFFCSTTTFKDSKSLKIRSHRRNFANSIFANV
jgi:hypothetical protein